MKIVCIVLGLTSWAAIPGATYTSQATTAPDKQSSESPANAGSGQPSNKEAAAPVDQRTTSRTPSDARGGHTSVNHRAGHANLAKANSPKQFSDNGKNGGFRELMNVHQRPSINRSTGAAIDPAAKSELSNQTRSVRPPGPLARLSLNNARHRGPNPAIVGGVANSNVRNAGTINGTRMSRKP